MKKICYSFLVLALLPWPAAAETPALKQGVWPGTIKLAGKDTASARVLVSNETDDSEKVHTRIVMFVEDIPLEFVDLEIRKSKLLFKIDTGTTNECALDRKQNGSYAGFCTSVDAQDKDSRIELSMRPPASEEETPPATEPPAEVKEVKE